GTRAGATICTNSSGYCASCTVNAAGSVTTSAPVLVTIRRCKVVDQPHVKHAVERSGIIVPIATNGTCPFRRALCCCSGSKSDEQRQEGQYQQGPEDSARHTTEVIG